MADTWYTMSNYYGYDTSHTTPISNGYNTSAQYSKCHNADDTSAQYSKCHNADDTLVQYTKCHNYGWHEVYNANLLR